MLPPGHARRDVGGGCGLLRPDGPPPGDEPAGDDAHSGAFLAALAAGLPPEDAARRANAAAALSTTRSGPATSPTRSELDAFLQP